MACGLLTGKCRTAEEIKHMPQPPTPETVTLLAQEAGLVLPDAYLPELLAAYTNVRRMIDSLPTNRPRGDEPAHVFMPTHFRPEGK
jgi:hypothetical protein